MRNVKCKESYLKQMQMQINKCKLPMRNVKCKESYLKHTNIR